MIRPLRSSLGDGFDARSANPRPARTGSACSVADLLPGVADQVPRPVTATIRYTTAASKTIVGPVSRS
jgi:hypothetical protein